MDITYCLCVLSIFKTTAHRPRLYMERCCRATLDCVCCKTEAIAFVEIAEPLAPSFEVDQALPLLGCLSMESQFVLSDVRLLSSLEAPMKSGRGQPFRKASPLLPELNTYFTRGWDEKEVRAVV